MQSETPPTTPREVSIYPLPGCRRKSDHSHFAHDGWDRQGRRKIFAFLSCSNDIYLSLTTRLSRRKWVRSCCRTLRGTLENMFYLCNDWNNRWPPHLLPAPMLWLMKEVTMCPQLGTQRLWCSPSSKKCRCANSLENLVMNIFNSRHQKEKLQC